MSLTTILKHSIVLVLALHFVSNAAQPYLMDPSINSQAVLNEVDSSRYTLDVLKQQYQMEKLSSEMIDDTLDRMGGNNYKSLLTQDSAMDKPDNQGNKVFLVDTSGALNETKAYEVKKIVPHKQRYSRTIFERGKGDLFNKISNHVGPGYPLKSGDQLKLSMWGDQEKEYRITLNKNGEIFLEGVGLLSLNGLTLGEAENVIRKKLARKYSGLRRGTAFFALRVSELSPVKVYVLGEVIEPGGYVFEGNTDLLLALYEAGGPTKIGSVRNIELTRDGNKQRVDLYDLLFNKGKKPFIKLRDGDIIYLPVASKLVSIKGEVGREATFELRESESFKDLLVYAKNLKPTASKNSFAIKRFLEPGNQDFLELQNSGEYLNGKKILALKHGDEIEIFPSSYEKANMVGILGPVHSPGEYGFYEGMEIKDLIQLASGLKEYVFKGRIQVLRERIDGSKQLLSMPLEGEGVNQKLRPRDKVILYSQRELNWQYQVSISGSVRFPGVIEYFDGITVRDLVLLAGGYAPDKSNEGSIIVESVVKGKKSIRSVIHNISEDFSSEQNIVLNPFDNVVIKKNVKYYEPEIVKIAGAVKQPGGYALKHKGEKLATFLKRVGGFESDAYLGGAAFFRIAEGRIGLELEEALDEDPNHNLILKAGDSLYIPDNKVAIKVTGGVNAPSSVLYKKGELASYYIAKAGGFARNGDDDRVYVKYANGEISSVDRMDRPPEPGAEIVVPVKPPPEEKDWLTITSQVASIITTLLAATVTIINNSK